MELKSCLFALLIGVSLASVLGDEAASQYRICVPHLIISQCKEFLENPPSNVAKVTCVEGRDRMDCMERVKNREADFLFVDPEDMYVAYQMSNQDFSVFSELRTVEEPSAEFRYEGIILLRKNSNIHSLADLKGKKSCHTGYGRNVGFKIPIAKLKKNGVFHVENETVLSPAEKELKALSNFFSKACIVGKWSPNADVNQVWKKRYSNLCEMCEHPDVCDYPDKFSGYDGSIRCLAENNGDVAFTKTIFVKKYFGLPIGHGNTATPAPAIGNPDEYEYLCVDGSRQPVTGTTPCSWAQRPWQGYMSNADVNNRVKKLQERLESFYEDGKKSPNKAGAYNMTIEEKYKVVAKEKPVLPGEHLIKAEYKDVIERDGSTQQKIRFCVSSEIEMRKCQTLKKAAYSRDIRPEIMCIEMSKTQCITAVKANEADIIAIHANDYQEARRAQLDPIIYEQLDADDVYVVVVPKDSETEMIRHSDVSFDSANIRSVNAALEFLLKRETKQCPNTISSNPSSTIKVVRSTELKNYNSDSHKLVCPDLTKKDLSDAKDCNFEYTLLTAIFSRPKLSAYELDNINHAFTAISDKFGHKGKIEQVFELFAEYEKGQTNIIFDDNASRFATVGNFKPTVDEAHYNELRCQTS